MTENEFRNRIATRLKQSGWTVRCEAPATGGGKIDILAHRGVEAVVIETKLHAGFHSVAAALGQLCLYADDRPHVRRYIATADPIPAALATRLTRFQVEPLPRSGCLD